MRPNNEAHMSDEEIIAFNKELEKHIPDMNRDDRREYLEYSYWIGRNEPDLANRHKEGYDRYTNWLQTKEYYENQMFQLSDNGRKEGLKQMNKEWTKHEKELDKESRKMFGNRIKFKKVEGNITQIKNNITI